MHVGECLAYRAVMQWRTLRAVHTVAACVMVLVPGSSCGGDEPLAASITPEPMASVEGAALTAPAEVFPGTIDVDVVAATATSSVSQPVLTTHVVALPQEKVASDEDDGLLLRAKQRSIDALL